MTILMFLAGLAGLIAGAELLVRGASKLAPVSYTHLTLPTKA